MPGARDSGSTGVDERGNRVRGVGLFHQIQTTSPYPSWEEPRELSADDHGARIVLVGELAGEDLAVPDVEPDGGVISDGVAGNDGDRIRSDSLDHLEVRGFEQVRVVLDEEFGEAVTTDRSSA